MFAILNRFLFEVIYIKRFLIKNVTKNSIAQKSGIKRGNYLISVNGVEIKDVFDYQYLITEENITVKIEDEFGKPHYIEIFKQPYEDIGLEFDTFLMDNTQYCRNNCIFCFINQLPKGMRSTLYFKDDDIRLSFLYGNYVTLTNCIEKDISRIIRYKMSPINISVHTTNPELRCRMLNNVNAGDIYKHILKLCQAGIQINCQIVLCRGINDGTELDKTLTDLSLNYPQVQSVSVVPVGLTKFGEGKYNLIPYDENSSTDVILQIEKHQRENLKKYNSRIVFPADEFFIMAGLEIPSNKYYEEYYQIENGVGITTYFMHEFYNSLNKRKKRNIHSRKIDIVTGVLASQFIIKACDEIKAKFNGLDIKIHVVKNNFFGKNITVAGLITGRDIVEQVKHKTLSNTLLIPDIMLKYDTELFLDDYTVDMVQEELGVDVVIVKKTAVDFIKKIVGPS